MNLLLSTGDSELETIVSSTTSFQVTKFGFFKESKQMFKESDLELESEIDRNFSDKAQEMCKVSCKICNSGKQPLLVGRVLGWYDFVSAYLSYIVGI